MDFKDLVQHTVEQIAADRFDEATDGIVEWTREALIGEWGDDAQKDAQYVLYAALKFSQVMYDLEAAGAFTRAVSQLRERYVDWAIKQGTYDREAYWDAVDYAADAADNARAAREDEAAQAGLRG
jgi:hypothetical protein